MENAADALKIGFALLVFVVALTIVFNMISKVKTTSDAILYYADETNYQSHMDATTGTNRTVHKSDVISTLYRYYKESISVTVKLGTNEYVFDKGNESRNGTKQVLNTEEKIEENLADFIQNTLTGDSFTEEFVEVPISGIYLTHEDGSEIALSSGGKKVYVTYTLN